MSDEDQEWYVWDLTHDVPLRLSKYPYEEWWHHFNKGLFDAGFGGWQRSGLGPDAQLPLRDEWTLTGFDDSRLWVVQTGEHEWRLFVAAHAPLTDASARPWSSAFNYAHAHMGDRRDFAWRAFVGQGLGAKYEHGQLMSEPADVGGLHLEPGGVAYMEYGRNAFGGSGNIITSWPVIVTGSSNGYAWQEDAVETANGSLHRLCSLLSVAWNSYWTVRKPAFEAEYAPMELPLGGMQEHWNVDDATPNSQHTVPDWLGIAWSTLDTDDALRRAVGGFREGVALEEEHPSMALIAYVAVIETIGDTTPLERCEKCQTMIGSTKRFKASVASVMDEMAAKQLGVIYDRRSKTAHASHLHGGETRVGGFSRSFFRLPPDDLHFEMESLRPMRTAARRLILMRLGQEPNGVW